MTNDMRLEDRGPAVQFPPPLPFAIALGIGALLDRFAHLPASWPALTHRPMFGAAMFAFGAGMVLTGMVTFKRHRTAIYPNQPARNLVTSGIYRYTRNPMYLGLSVAYLGVVVATGSLWSLLLLPLVLAVIVTQVIDREEQHLLERFPEEFTAYARTVRRWL